MTLPRSNNLTLLPVDNAHQIAEVATLAKEIWTEYYSSILSPEQLDYMIDNLQSFNAIFKVIESGELEYFLIQVDEVTVGYLALGKQKGALLISKCYLLKQTRGKGYFRSVLEEVEKIAQEAAYTQLKLYVNKYNESLKIYEHHGFKVSGSYHFDIGSGYIMDDYEMRKNIEKRHLNGNE